MSRDGGEQEDTAESKGQPAYIGYEYQIFVTVWVALELIFQRGLPHIEIEPASQEDIEAQLNVNREEASAIFRTETLAIQVKFRQLGVEAHCFSRAAPGEGQDAEGKEGTGPPRAGLGLPQRGSAPPLPLDH